MTLVRVRERLALAAAVLLLAATAVAVLPGDEGVAQPVAEKSKVSFWLTIGHNNDGESQLIDAGTGLEDYGGVARLASLIKRAEEEALARRNGGFILLNAGDNFLAGAEFNASLEKGVPYYDSIALNRMGFAAMGIGNHEFDFGPVVFAEFIKGFDPDVPFVSANLNVNGEPKLARLADQGRIVKRVVVREHGQRIGIVGITTPDLPFISSPGDVTVKPVRRSVQNQIDQLTAQGVDIIITVSQLQSIEEDIALGPKLTGVDIMVSGGGNELLADPGEGDLLIPGDDAILYGSYPLWTTDKDGRDVPVVTTSGDYRYLGQLVAGFNDRGRLVKVNDEGSKPLRVTSLVNPDGVEPASYIQNNVVAPVQAAIADMAANVVATSEVDLEGRRDPGVRTQETNEGNLIADALLWKATELAGDFGAPTPDISIQNGGGIRNNSLIPAGDISELDVFGMVPFANFVVIVPDVPPETLKELLENAVSRLPTADGRFAQVAGFSFTYDLTGTAQVIDENGVITTPGTRIEDVTLDGGTPIIQGGAVAPGAPNVDIATIDFSARGGDQYPFGGAPYTSLLTTYFDATLDYIVTELAGSITAADYPEGGEGRITDLTP